MPGSDTGTDTPMAEALTCSVVQGNSIASQNPEVALLLRRPGTVEHREAHWDCSMN